MTPSHRSSRRLLALLLSVALSLTLVGFLTGTRDTPERAGYHASAEPRGHEFARAPKQRDMALTRYAARARAQELALAEMRTPPRALHEGVERDAESRAAELAARAEARAYDGAPPTIPHAVDQRGAPGCLSCHGQGLRVRVSGELGDKIAKPISHALYASCLQCHATRDGAGPASLPLELVPTPANGFQGLRSPGPGARAYPGAPPQMPHKSFMRERCESCHGVWSTGIASSHPWRQSCRQCHTPAALADQAPASALGALPGSPVAP